MTEVQSANLDRDIAKIDAAQARAQLQAQQESSKYEQDAKEIIFAVENANPGFTWHVAQSPQDHTGWARKQPPMPAVPTPQAKPAERPPYPARPQADVPGPTAAPTPPPAAPAAAPPAKK